MKKENKPKEKTAEQLAQEFLEDKLTQAVLGANKAHALYGDAGVQAYQAFMAGEDVWKAKQDSYKSTKAEYAKMGVVGEPAYLTDADFSAKTMSQISEFMAFIPLGNLEKILNSIDKLEFKVPEKLKGFTQHYLIKKAYDEKEEKINSEKLSKDEQIALELLDKFFKTYGDMCAYRSIGENYLEGINAFGKAVEKEYSGKKAD